MPASSGFSLPRSLRQNCRNKSICSVWGIRGAALARLAASSAQVLNLWAINSEFIIVDLAAHGLPPKRARFQIAV